MSKIFYCPENPLAEEHSNFYGHGTAQETHYIDENGILTDVESGDTLDSPNAYYCVHCDAIAVLGTPPSALELLAKEAE